MLDIPSPSLRNSQKAILYAIAVNGPGYGYEIYKKSFRRMEEFNPGLTNKTVYIELKELEAKGLVEVKESFVKSSSKRKRGRPPKTQYSLTLLGLCCALATTKPDSYTSIGPVLAKWGFLVPSINSMWQAIHEKDFTFEYNLCKSFGDLAATTCMGGFWLSSEVCEDAIVFDLIYHFYEQDLRPPFFGTSIFYHFKPIFLKCSEFKKRTESFAKILWLDSKWRSLLLEQRRTLFEQPPVDNPLDLLPEYNKHETRLGTRAVYQELEEALAEWPLSFKQFLKLKALHEIWLIKEGEFGLELSMQP